MFVSLWIVAFMSALSIGIFFVCYYIQENTGFPALTFFPAVIIPLDYFLLYVGHRMALLRKISENCSDIQSILQKARKDSYVS